MANESNTDPAHDELDRELDGALQREEFFLLYQPTIDLRTGAFVGVEALLRWRSPSLGVTGPETFLARLEASGRIVDVGAWVLSAACRQGATWHEKGHRFSVSVNVAPAQVTEALAGQVALALEESGFGARHLVLEFSIRTLVATGAADVAAALHDLGVRLAIDDLGASPGAEEILRDGLVDVVKIDRTSVRALGSEGGAARLDELVSLAERLHVQTVAQGVEDDDQRLRLAGARVDVGQGFLFSVPHTDLEIDRFLEDYAIFSGRPL